jgi:hypothetical protein
MYEKNIKFKDFFGSDRIEKRYFNLSEAEVLDAQFDKQGDFSQLVQGIANTKDIESLGKLFKEIILRSYGEPSPDGIYFNKSKEIRDRFENSALYNALYTELLFDADAASEFINHVIPVDSIQKLTEKAKESQDSNLTVV